MSRQRMILAKSVRLVIGLCLLWWGDTLAQGIGEELWTDPINLSQSGAATTPLVVAGPENSLRVLWWDAFDGITTRRYTEGQWSSPQLAPVLVTEEIRGQFVTRPLETLPETEEIGGQFVTRPLETFPEIVGDANGHAHAIWLAAPDSETELRALLHSRLLHENNNWEWAQVIAPSALSWRLVSAANGVLHLIYLRPTHTTTYPAGIYYRKSTDGGQTWSSPLALYTTIYFRLLDADAAYLDLATDGTGEVVVTWRDEYQNALFYARSLDEGKTWSDPVEVDNRAGAADHPQLTFDSNNEAFLLWKSSQDANSCTLYQQRVPDDAAAWEAPERILSIAARCPQSVSFHRSRVGQLLLVAKDHTGNLTLAMQHTITTTDNESVTTWSQPKQLEFIFADPEAAELIHLDTLATLWEWGGALVVVGHGQNDQIWLLRSQGELQKWTSTPSSPWTKPTTIAERTEFPSLPALAIDDNEIIHLVWSESEQEELPGTALIYTRCEGERWAKPIAILHSAEEEKVTHPAFIAVDEYLHVVWSGGQRGEIFYSQALAEDACVASNWSQPQLLSQYLGEQIGGDHPMLVASRESTLHVVYAVPLNEGRGIYYTYSDDHGNSWSEPTPVFDATVEGWAMVDHPSLAISAQGVLHITWVRSTWWDISATTGWVYYAHSMDNGKTWSPPLLIDQATCEHPQVVTTLTGQVHLLWTKHEDGRPILYHQWSLDEGERWSSALVVGGIKSLYGVNGIDTAGNGRLHLLGLEHADSEETTLSYTFWDKEAWQTTELVHLRMYEEYLPGAVMVLQERAGKLPVIFRQKIATTENNQLIAIRYLARTIPVMTDTLTTLTPVITPRSTPTPLPTLTPAVSATPRPEIDPDPPVITPSLSLGPITLPYLALGGISVVFLLIGGTVLTQWLRARN
ncbi:MAG: exo-alpha-sialidase [Anaerolineae bacterium]|nr:exo-alpha-sialidase [Anaerolineae bacterium]